MAAAKRYNVYVATDSWNPQRLGENLTLDRAVLVQGHYNKAARGRAGSNRAYRVEVTCDPNRRSSVPRAVGITKRKKRAETRAGVFVAPGAISPRRTRKRLG